MTELRLYNTLTHRKEPFRPIDEKNVRMYVCGPTVYDYAHIGNARPVIVFDVLFRLLRHIYGADHVTYVRNITDVDDRINARALEEGVSIHELTERTARQYHEDVRALGCLPPTVEPRATGHIAEMKAMIEDLVAKGYAYVAEGHVLFDVSKKPDYGKLARRSLDEMMAGARVEVAPYKKNPMDFVLWKPSKPGEPSWPGPAGIGTPGRPGWHIECSAMGWKHLGETFDIHGGGIDLVFPHHENEIAQSEAAHGGRPLANVWMHNGFLQIEREKMSKSLGNFVTINQLLSTDAFGGRRWRGEVLRLAMLMTHYRQPIDWTLDRLQEAESRLNRWLGTAFFRGIPERGQVSAEFLEVLADDLNSAIALSVLDELATRRRSPTTKDPVTVANDLAATLRWLGIATDKDFEVARADSEDLRNTIRAAYVGLEKDYVMKQIAARNAARAAKNFAEADRIRAELESKGIELRDGPDGTTWDVKR